MLTRPLQLLLAFAALLIIGCPPESNPTVDFDSDGTLDADDCGPQDPAVHPGAFDEPGDGIDQNCDGVDGVDNDGDGYAEGDCNDDDPNSWPGAPDELGDDVDQNCDGIDGVDSDGDGTRDSEDCAPDDAAVHPRADDPEGDASDQNCDGVDGVDGDGDGFAGADCDDSDPDAWPGAADTAGDGVDTNCDGVDGVDSDGDGTEDGADCGAQDPAIHPGAEDPQGDSIDQNCDGVDGVDGDGDGFAGEDCDDSAADTHPGADDPWGDGVDQDCDGSDGTDGDSDGTVAELDCDDADPARSAEDLDGDGVSTCDAPADCDDTDPTRSPLHTEACDGLDNDCDDSSQAPGGELDGDGDGDLACADCDDTAAALGGLDDDGDGFSECDAPADCDDDDASVYPGAPDAPGNGVDDDCDGLDGQDRDGDGFPGNAASDDPLWDCDDLDPALNRLDSDADGEDTCEGDCDDADPARSPAAVELCDGVDSDCDDDISDELDGDGDGFAPCAQPEPGHSYGLTQGGDCDDGDALTHPGAAQLDSATACMTDADGDGWGAPDASLWVPGAEDGGDCDDHDPSTFPGAAQAEAPGLCMTDADGDGWGDLWATSPTQPGTDCDDDDGAMFPTNVDLCDGRDADCGGEPERDADGDGYVNCDAPVSGWLGPGGEVLLGGDCDDDDDLTHPGAATAELTSLCTRDGDGDGWGDPELSLSVPAGADGTDCDDEDDDTWPGAAGAEDASLCARDADGDGWGDTDPSGGATAGTDCDDENAQVHPTADDFCDGYDSDCDGYVETDGDHDGFANCDSPVPTWNPTLLGGSDCDDEDAFVRPQAASREPDLCTRDMDWDGYGDDQVTADSPNADDGTDCDDGDIYANPGAGANEAVVGGCYRDADGDSWGDVDTAPEVLPGSDCDDSVMQIYPGAPEYCDGQDTDCVESPEEDEDEDGWVSCDDPVVGWLRSDGQPWLGGGDCDDADDRAYPGAARWESDTACMQDHDADGWGAASPNSATSGTDCDDEDDYATPADWDLDGASSCAGDCDDETPLIRPGAADIPTLLPDADCDGEDFEVDEDHGYFVMGGAFGTIGSRVDPFGTLSEGLLAAEADPSRPHVFVHGMMVYGPVTTSVSIHGGFDNAWTQDLDNPTVLACDGPTAVTLAAPTSGERTVVLSGLAIEANGPGASGKAIHVPAGSRPGDSGLVLNGVQTSTGDTSLNRTDSAGLYLEEGWATVVDSQIEAGDASHASRGILLMGTASVVALRSTVSAGAANSGVGVEVGEAGWLTAVSSIIEGGRGLSTVAAEVLGVLGYDAARINLFSCGVRGGGELNGAQATARSAVGVLLHSMAPSPLTLVNNTIVAGVGQDEGFGLWVGSADEVLLLNNHFSSGGNPNTDAAALRVDHGLTTARNNSLHSWPGWLGAARMAGHDFEDTLGDGCDSFTDICFDILGFRAVDPLLVGPSLVHLDSASPLRDAGVDPSPWTLAPYRWLDIDGDARPLGAALDIGADEYVP